MHLVLAGHEGISLKGEFCWREPRTWSPKGDINCLGVVVEYILHNANVVFHYEIMSFYVPCMGIHADYIVITNVNT